MSDWVVKVTSPKGKLLLTGTYERDGTFTAKGEGYGAYGLRSVQELAQRVGVVKSDAPRAHVEWRVDRIPYNTSMGLPIEEELQTIVRDPWTRRVEGQRVPLTPHELARQKERIQLEGRTAVPIKLLANPRPPVGPSRWSATGAKKKPAMDLAISRKVNPSALRTSGKMYALLGYILGRDWTSPEIIEMKVTSDGYVLATTSDGAMGQFFGTSGDLINNLHGLWHEGVITQPEANYLVGRFTARTR